MQHATHPQNGQSTDTVFHQLQKLQHMPHAYEEWAAYRESLTDFIIRHTNAGAVVLIVGAGMCNDLDLNRLAAHFSQVVLLDHDAAAMRMGLVRQGVQPDNVKIVQADILGIPDEDYIALCNALLLEIRRQAETEPAPDVIEDRFLSYMNAAFGNRSPDAIVRQEAVADYVVCCGVHSQLLSMFAQIAGVYRRYAAFDTERVLNAVRSMNATVARECNARLIGLAKRGVILGVEEGRVGTQGGVEGAAQALDDLEARRLPIAAETHLYWPFDRSQGKIYDMRIMLISRENETLYRVCGRGNA